MACKIAFAMFLLLVAVLSVTYAQSRSCRTPDGKSGSCINLKQCPELITLLTTGDRTEADYDYVRRSQCGFAGSDPLVCCPSSSSSDYPPSTTTQRPNEPYIDVPEYDGGSSNCHGSDNDQHTTDSPLLPGNCGKQEGDRIIGGNRTGLYDYPWMALLEYDTPNGVKLACGGALISSRYVLTAAHCLKGRTLSSSWKLNRVRLGEYNVETQRDCIPDGDTGMICADEPVVIPVEERIAHEDYDPQNGDQRYDIALLRLSREARFTSFVKPICLPRSSRLDPKFRVVGWGRTESRGHSDVKLQVIVPSVPMSQCKPVYQSLSIVLGEGQLCAGGEEGKDSCTGDSGGPLMQQERYPNGDIRWIAVGVVSFGPRNCGTYGMPGVYTKTYDFMPWIEGKLRR